MLIKMELSMKINFNSIVFKSLTIIIISISVFAIYVSSNAKSIFEEAYLNVINQKMSIIEKSITPSIALNLSYGFDKSITEILKVAFNNTDILLLKVESDRLANEIIFSKENKTLSELESQSQFISNINLLDPVTDETIGKLVFVYSNDSYNEYMKKFYKWLASGVVLLMISIIAISAYVYNSLKDLSVLENSLKNFNPAEPKLIEIDIKSKNEIASITSSANIMINNISKYINYSKALNQKISEQQKHLKDAQRIAHVGSWEYNIITKQLILSDEMYRMINKRSNSKIKWEEFLDYIAPKDKEYITSVFDKAIINGSIFDLKYSIITENNTHINLHTAGKVRKKANGSAKLTSVSRDITEDVKNKETIEQLAYYDSLTKLPNRLLLKDRTHKALQNAQREGKKVALIFLDLDHFKLINDTLGHSTGDDLLVYVSKTLKNQLRESDTIARLGGDEFVILLHSVNNIKDAEFIANKLLNSLRGRHTIGLHQLYITTSIGISIYPDNSKDMNELITNADTAMYDAKNDGRNNYKIYSKDMGNYISKQMSTEQDLRIAIKNEAELELYYQPKIDSKTNIISGAEALIRWNHPENGLMYPDEFIEVAESTGMILEMGKWIISSAIMQVKEWNKLGFTNLKVAINLSPRQFQDKDLVELIKTSMNIHEILPHQLEFEVTETMSMSNIENTLRTLQELKELGVTLAIDDFGTGYSSLSYLKRFPVNTLKIDKSFVIDMTEDEEDRTIVQTIISMAHTLGFQTVAEGVESQKHADILKDMGCDELQGYHFSRPIPKDKFTKYLQDYTLNL